MRYPRYFRRRGPFAWLLWPLSKLFCALVGLRRSLYRVGMLHTRRFPRPLIVVGNISVGGVGKTPFVIFLIEQLQQMGWRPGVVARGYRGESDEWPLLVDAQADARRIGDEPLLIARRGKVPVCVGPDRPAAVEQLLAGRPEVDVVISDDGLQHYRMGRDLELAIVDAVHGLDNGFCLPAGPLREPKQRLESVDAVFYNGNIERRRGMRLTVAGVARLNKPETLSPLSQFAGERVHAVAGIGDPERFFRALEAAGIRIVPHPFPDHHAYHAEDLAFNPPLPILMTEKDAVKCGSFDIEDLWQVRVDLQLNQLAFIELRQLLRRGLKAWNGSG